MLNELGQKLKKYRESVFPDMGLRRVADIIGIDYSYLYRVEDGKYTPSDEMLIKITEAYKLSPQEQLELFHMIHSGAYEQLIHKVYTENPKTFNKTFVFNRKKKK